MRDATGVRREVGKHSVLLNIMSEEHTETLEEKKLKDAKNHKKSPFQEFVGHTPAQVLVGAILGIIVPIFVRLIPTFSQVS